MDTQNGWRQRNGPIGQPGLFPRQETITTVSGGLVSEPKPRYGPTNDFGKCACGVRLYRKHRIASSLLNLIDQARNTSMPLSERPRSPVTGLLNISCRNCGTTLEVGFAVSRPTMVPQASMNIALNMQLKTTASTSSVSGISRVQTMMDLLLDDDDFDIMPA